MNLRLRLLAAAAALSGAACLMYGALWVRFCATVLGSTVQVAGAVIVALLVGLALGARLAGATIDRRHGAHLASWVYLFIELGVALFAVGVGWSLHHLREQLPAVLAQGAGRISMVRAFAISLGAGLVPALLIGATFPAVLSVGRRWGGDGVAMVRLWGASTLGAAAGALLWGWYAMAAFGAAATLLIAGGLNLAAALLCVPLVWAEKSDACEIVRPQPHPARAIPGLSEPDEANEPDRFYLGHQAWLHALSVFSGAAILALAVIWLRVASFTLGNRTFALSAGLAWILLLLAGGAQVSSWLVVRFAGRIPHFLALLLLAAAAGIVLSTVIVNAWILSPGNLGHLFSHSPAVVVLLRLLAMGAIMAMFLVPLGCLFPTGLVCLRAIDARSGGVAGRYYLWHALGAAAGFLLAGFLLLPVLGSFGCAAVLALLCALGAVLIRVPAARTRDKSAAVGVAVAAVIIIAIPLLMPEQLHVARADERRVLRVEDASGVFQLSALPDGRLRVTDNRTDRSFLVGDFSTSYVQEMQAHLASFMRPTARTAVVLGSGFGMTAGAFTANPGIQHIDAVEALPALVAAARFFEPYNRAYQRNPRVHVTVDDGRHFLARSNDHYDIVSLDAPDPHLPGGSALFNADFYQVIKRHLNPEGVVSQSASGVDADVVLSTLKQAFHYLRAFPSIKNGFNVIASDGPLRPRREDVEALASVPTMAEALADLGLLSPIDPWLIVSRGYGPSALSGLLHADVVSTDDRPVLEFSRRGNAMAWFFSDE